ncbi:MAG: histidine phosphatase family protein [Alphaproteobacteria bacterium]|nr:histidine phosphatase family protein [Alphaproteobacteria bacterium]
MAFKQNCSRIYLMTKLIIARHGNTFGPDDTPTRIGARTDLPLVESGQTQGEKLGAWLKENEVYPEVVYSSELQRTKQTAEIALKALGYPQPVFPLAIFNEIDYGPDENQAEDQVIARIGEQAIKDWDEKAIVPNGWEFVPDECIQNWKGFAQHIVDDEQDCVMVVTSNGTARFAPHLAGNFEEFANNNKIKLSTGALGILEYKNGAWNVTDWNIRP